MEKEHKQRTDEWKQARCGYVTASQFGKVLYKRGGFTKTAESYFYALLAESLTGQPAYEFTSRATDWGNEQEPIARQAYLWHREAAWESGFAKHPTEALVGGSPDGRVGKDGMVEIKCPYNSAVHAKTMHEQQMPQEHKPQVQGLLWVLERNWCDFVSFDPRMPTPETQCVVLRQERDEPYIKTLAKQVCEFRDLLLEAINRYQK